MNLVNSIISYYELSNDEIDIITNVFYSKYMNNIKVQKYKYGDRKFFEVDFDLIDFIFNKEKILNEIDELILVYEEMFNSINKKLDLIVANDDTDAEIIKYEEDWNDIQRFGLFVTSRGIPNIQPYYSSNICNVYLNLDYVSFGVIF